MKKKLSKLLDTPVGSKQQRIKDGVHPQLEHCLLEWFFNRRSEGVSISGPLLQEKARSFAIKLGVSNFRASDGWLTRFKKQLIKQSSLINKRNYRLF